MSNTAASSTTKSADKPHTLDELEQNLVKSGIFVDDRIYFTRLISANVQTVSVTVSEETAPCNCHLDHCDSKVAEDQHEHEVSEPESKVSKPQPKVEKSLPAATIVVKKPNINSKSVSTFHSNRVVAAKAIKIDENLLIHRALRIFLKENGLKTNSLNFNKLIPLTKHLNSKNPFNINRNSLRKILKYRHFKITKQEDGTQQVSLNDTLFNQLKSHIVLPITEKSIYVHGLSKS
ncbi:unnamed protein product [Ambrosiozyma monospora]|uniref:Unnamed protein product n=1 Tax=Ambrosiozyma monospora TaxID=43982 RepID=A0A9W6Z3A7_AMBMO|nr:unnamed protein product [Ambrosiozyma monospora]